MGKSAAKIKTDIIKILEELKKPVEDGGCGYRPARIKKIINDLKKVKDTDNVPPKSLTEFYNDFLGIHHELSQDPDADPLELTKDYKLFKEFFTLYPRYEKMLAAKKNDSFLDSKSSSKYKENIDEQISPRSIKIGGP